MSSILYIHRSILPCQESYKVRTRTKVFELLQYNGVPKIDAFDSCSSYPPRNSRKCVNIGQITVYDNIHDVRYMKGHFKPTAWTVLSHKTHIKLSRALIVQPLSALNSGQKITNFSKNSSSVSNRVWISNGFMHHDSSVREGHLSETAISPNLIFRE